MGCCCPGKSEPKYRLARRSSLPQLFKSQSLPPELHILALNAELASLTSLIHTIEIETDDLKQRSKGLTDDSVHLKREFLVNIKTLSALKHLLRRNKTMNQDDPAHLQVLCSELCVFENLQREFEEKMLRPCECEEGLYQECITLEKRWEEQFEQVKELLQRTQELQGELPAIQAIKALPNAKEKQTKMQLVEDTNDAEISILYLCAICQKKFQQLKQISSKLREVRELKNATQGAIAESEGLRKLIEAKHKQEDVYEELHDEIVQIEVLEEVMVAAEAEEQPQEEYITVRSHKPPPLASIFPFEESLTDMLAHSDGSEGLGAVHASNLEIGPLTSSSERVATEPKMSLSEQILSPERSFSRDSQRKGAELTWAPSNVTQEGNSSSFSPFETFALFESAVKDAQLDDTPRACMERHLQKNYKEHASETWTEWLTGLNNYCQEDLPYAKVILAAMQQGSDCMPTVTAKQALVLIQAANRLADAVETDNAADSTSFGEVTISEEFDKTLYSGGEMYWVDCFDLIYSALSIRVGTKVLQRLKPDSVTLSDYITFQICHKMHVKHLDGIKIFKLLDRNQNGKLDAVEFSKGLHDLLQLWVSPEDVTHTFRGLYNRWSGLVSKAQFSKQVNFTEYMRRCKGDLAHLSKYAFLLAFLQACQTQMREALTLLHANYDGEEDLREIQLDFVERCFQVATDQSDVAAPLTLWQHLLKERFGVSSPALSFTEAMQAFVDSLFVATSPETWVGDSLSVIGSRTLQEVLLAGSHDSGSFYLTTNLMVGAADPSMEALIQLAEKLNVPVEDVITPWGRSQDQTFYEQMQGGIRYFDLRSGWDNVTQTWRAFHFESGLPVQSLVNDVRMFLLDYPSEIVIIEASHFWGNPTDAQIQLLADILMLELGDLMYPIDNGAFALTIAEMVSTNQRAVVTMETIVGSYPKIFNGNVIYNTYANSNQLEAMVQFNLQTAQQFTNSTWPNQLFKMSWTLTPATDVILESVLIDHPHSLLDLADVANPHLPAFWQQVQANGWKLGNILIIDHYEASQILQVVLEANGIAPQFLSYQ